MNDVADTLAGIETESGVKLLTLTVASPVLLVFLRRFGCTFCRQTIIRMGELKGELEARGVRTVFVHMGTPEIAKAHFDYYGLGEVERVHDPEAAVYRHPVFGLRRQSEVRHVLTPSVWWSVLKGAGFNYKVESPQTDGQQMPGIFFLKGGVIVRKFVHKTIADEPDYLRLVA